MELFLGDASVSWPEDISDGGATEREAGAVEFTFRTPPKDAPG